MNEVLKAIKERRSVRKYLPELPSEEMLAQIAEAGIYAPSGMNKQTSIVLCVTNKELRDRLSAANAAVLGSNSDPFYGAPAVFVVLAKKDEYNHVYDGTLTMENMMLAAHSLGLGSCWINRARQVFEQNEYKQLLADLGIEGEWEGIGHCIVGYPDGEIPEAKPREPGRVINVK